MIIALIVVALIITGIVMLILSKNLKFKYATRDMLDFMSGVFIVLGIVASIFVGAFIIATQTNKDLEYQNILHTREMLEYRIEHMSENITGNEMLYNDIVEFNNKLRATKKWANSLWTNWFTNQDVAAIDYVVIDMG